MRTSTCRRLWWSPPRSAFAGFRSAGGDRRRGQVVPTLEPVLPRCGGVAGPAEISTSNPDRCSEAAVAWPARSSRPGTPVVATPTRTPGNPIRSCPLTRADVSLGTGTVEAAQHCVVADRRSRCRPAGQLDRSGPTCCDQVGRYCRHPECPTQSCRRPGAT
jgi:hypothetical protein